MQRIASALQSNDLVTALGEYTSEVHPQNTLKLRALVASSTTNDNYDWAVPIYLSRTAQG